MFYTFSMTVCKSCCSFCNCFSANRKRSLSSLISSLCKTVGVSLQMTFTGDEMTTGWTGESATGAVDDEIMLLTYSGCLLCQWP